MNKLLSLSLSLLLLSQTVAQAEIYLYCKDSKATAIRTAHLYYIPHDEIIKISGDYATPLLDRRVCGYVPWNRDGCSSSLSKWSKPAEDATVNIILGGMTAGLFTIFAGFPHDVTENYEATKKYVTNSGYDDFKSLIPMNTDVDVINDFDLDDYTSKNTLVLTNNFTWNLKAADVLLQDERYGQWLYVDKNKSMADVHAQWLNIYASNTPTPEFIDIPTVFKPYLPHYIEPSLIITPKTEFETKAQFDERVKKATQENNNAVKEAKNAYHQAVNQIKENYADDVNDRNKKVKKEQEKYKEAIEDANKQRAKIKSKLSEVSDHYKKILVLFSLGKPQISNPIYDAESQYLKVDFYDPIAKESKALPIKMSPSDAKELKEHMWSAEIKAQYSFENDVVTLVKLSVNGAEYTPSAADKISHKIDFAYDFSKNNEIIVTQDELNRIFTIQDTAYGETIDESDTQKIIEIVPKSAALPSFHK